jgi:hypothetical protein
MPIVQSRRRFLTNAALAGAAGLRGFGAWSEAQAAGGGAARNHISAHCRPEAGA